METLVVVNKISKHAHSFEEWLQENKPHIQIKDKREYKNVRTPITYICSTHGEFTSTPQAVRSSKCGCKQCSYEGMSKAKSTPYTVFLQRAVEVHGDRFIYLNEQDSEYTSLKNKIKIFCPQCNKHFWQTGVSHLKGGGCLECYHKSLVTPYHTFLARAHEHHGDKYAYYSEEESGYTGSGNTVRIFCKACNKDFIQWADNHTGPGGHGCPFCHIESYDSMVARAQEIHGDKYEYLLEDEAEYKNLSHKIKIMCKSCNSIFQQKPSHHLRGQGCPKCAAGKGGANEKILSRNPELANEPCTLYYIYIAGAYKIGITKRSLHDRFSKEDGFKTILTTEKTRLYAYRSEQAILNYFAAYNIRNDQLKDGKTECFNLDISTLPMFSELFYANFDDPTTY